MTRLVSTSLLLYNPFSTLTRVLYFTLLVLYLYGARNRSLCYLLGLLALCSASFCLPRFLEVHSELEVETRFLVIGQNVVRITMTSTGQQWGTGGGERTIAPFYNDIIRGNALEAVSMTYRRYPTRYQVVHRCADV